MDIRDPEYRGMVNLALDRKDEIFTLQAEIKKLQKQNDLLTLGLLQEKDKVRKLKDALDLVYTENFSGQSRLSLYAKRQVKEALFGEVNGLHKRI